MIEKLSKKQLQTLVWWCDRSPYRELDAIICDGAVRSGKTLCMGLSFFCWAMRRFDGMQFGLCGKTIVSLRRNFIAPLLPLMFFLDEIEYGVVSHWLVLILKCKMLQT